MSTLRQRWTDKLEAATGRLSKARRQVAYWSTRAGSSHGAAMLRERVLLRTAAEREVAQARAVLDRHPTPVRGLSVEGLAFIAAREGFRSHPYYPTPGDKLTIGYGETQGVRSGMMWSKGYALKKLKFRADNDYGKPVILTAGRVGLKLRQHEYDALTSLVYNLGPGILSSGKTMGDAIRSKDRSRIANAFLVYDHGPRGPMLGLTLRRKAERKMFLNN